MMLVSVAIYAGFAWWAVEMGSNHFLWAAFNGFFLLRGLTLAVLFPTIIPDRRPLAA